MFKSLKQYLIGVLRWWWFLVISVGGGGLGVASIVSGEAFTVPIWVWVPIIVLGLSVAQFLAFHRVREERDELKLKVQQVAPSYIFIIENLGKEGFNPTNSTLTIPVGITVTPTMLVEDVQLQLLGKSIPSNWWQRRIGGSGEQHLVSFVIPEQVKSGEHTVHLVAIAEGHTAESKPFLVNFP